MSDRPISEEYRLTSKRWVDANAAASLLEETKSAFLSQKMVELGDMPVSRAEMTVKASPEWREYVTSMVEARKAANLLRSQLSWIEMRFTEQVSREATERAERKL